MNEIYCIRYITNPSHWTTTNKMLVTLCDEFAIRARRSETKQWQEFQEHMAALYQQDVTVVLLIDEAQLIPRRQMLRVREILNFESNSSKFIQVALFGTLDMAAILAEPDFRPLRSRAAGGIITLDPLDEQELTQALQFRMRVAGGPEDVFTAGLFSARLQGLQRNHPRRRGLLQYGHVPRLHRASAADQRAHHAGRH